MRPIRRIALLAWIAEIEGMGRGSHVVRAQVYGPDGPYDPFVIDFTVVNGSGT